MCAFVLRACSLLPADDLEAEGCVQPEDTRPGEASGLGKSQGAAGGRKGSPAHSSHVSFSRGTDLAHIPELRGAGSQECGRSKLEEALGGHPWALRTVVAP